MTERSRRMNWILFFTCVCVRTRAHAPTSTNLQSRQRVSGSYEQTVWVLETELRSSRTAASALDLQPISLDPVHCSFRDLHP